MYKVDIKLVKKSWKGQNNEELGIRNEELGGVGTGGKLT